MANYIYNQPNRKRNRRRRNRRRRKARLLIINFAILFFCIIIAFVIHFTAKKKRTDEMTKAKATTEAVTTEERTSEDTTEEATTEEVIDYAKAIAEGDYDTIFKGDCFIGDSRTEGLMTMSQIETADFLCDVGLHIVDSPTDSNIINGLSSKKYNNVYIQLGINDLGMYDLDKMKTAYVNLIKLIQEKQPDANIYVESIIPVSQHVNDTHPYNTFKNIDRINKIVIKAAKEGGATYLDVVPALCGNNSHVLPKDAATDGTHLNKKYSNKLLDFLAEQKK